MYIEADAGVNAVRAKMALRAQRAKSKEIYGPCLMELRCITEMHIMCSAPAFGTKVAEASAFHRADFLEVEQSTRLPSVLRDSAE